MPFPSKDKGKSKESVAPGSNWLALKARIAPSATTSERPSKKRRISDATITPAPKETPVTSISDSPALPIKVIRGSDTDVNYLRSMILGKTLPSSSSPSSSSQPSTSSHAKIGKYISLDCEMVGVGPPVTDRRTGKTSTRSSLARVSMVNYDGETVLDVFVKQKERVTDYRTAVSGVRPQDLVGGRAVSLEDAQQQVADVLKGRVLIGHAVHNDLKALLLKHSGADTHDTQKMPAIRAEYKTKLAGLRTIVKKEFDVDIQSGEHSSVVDARATMAVYRLYKNRPVKKKTDPPASTARSAELSADATLPSTSSIDDMPFRESKATDPNDEDEEPVDDEDTDPMDTPRQEKPPSPLPPPSIAPSSSLKTIKTPSKKRKRDQDADGLLLHVVSTSSPSTQAAPPQNDVNQPGSTSSELTPSKKKNGRGTSAKAVKGNSERASLPGGGRKGISSGLATVVRTNGVKKLTGKRAGVLGSVGHGHGRRGSETNGGGGGADWWSTL